MTRQQRNARAASRKAFAFGFAIPVALAICFFAGRASADELQLVATVEIDGESFAFIQDSGLSADDCAPREGFRHAVIRAWPGTIINGPIRFTCEKDETGR